MVMPARNQDDDAGPLVLAAGPVEMTAMLFLSAVESAGGGGAALVEDARFRAAVAHLHAGRLLRGWAALGTLAESLTKTKK